MPLTMQLRISGKMKVLSEMLLVVIWVFSCFGPTLFAQTAESPTTEANKWTATTDSENKNKTPIRIVETHSRNGNQTLDERSVQIRRSEGHFETYQDIEKETVQLDAATVRTTTRTFGRDVNGRKTLVQVTQEERHTLPGGDSNIVRITSDPDVNGRLQPVQREIVETKKAGNDGEETKTTVMLPSVNGGLAPVLKTDELRRRGANGTVESQKTTLLPDGEGNWQVNEIRQNTIRQEASNRSTEERVYRRDAEGKLSEVSHVVSKESESTSGEKRNIAETYSVDVPGMTEDGSLHLVERTTSTQRTNANGEQTIEQQLERRNPGNPDSGLRVYVVINGRTQLAPSGEQATQTIRLHDANGSFGVVSVDTTKSDKVPTVQIQQAR